MVRLLFLCITVMFMATGCAVAPKLRTDVPADEAGYVVFSIGADEQSSASYYKLNFRDPASRDSTDVTFFPSTSPDADRKPDFTSAAFEGSVFALRMKPGDYEIYNFTVRQRHESMSEMLFTAARDFSIPFVVEKGKVTYLGQYRAQLLKGKSVTGKEVTAIFYYVIEDQADRDIAVARARKIIPSGLVPEREVVVAPKVMHPFIRNEKWTVGLPPGTYHPGVK